MRQIEETTAQIERRLLRWMVILAVAAVAALAASTHGRFAAGAAAGAAIAITGYVWLLDAMAAVLNSENARITKWLATKLILRYPILLGALYIFYRTKWLPVEAVLAGLLIPLAGAVAECIYQLAGTTPFARPFRQRQR